MDTILYLTFAVAIISVIYKIVHIFTSNSVTANEDYFQQAGVKVDFKQQIINIKGKTYDVNKVTGINTVTYSGGKGMNDALRSTVGVVEISVDDFNKPIHRITISGGSGKAGNFSQRLCTALRKAGGPSFY